MSIEDKIDEFSVNLDLFDDDMQRYEYIIELSSELELLDERYKTNEYKVQGCQSNVWLYPYTKDDKFYFKADSDALIVKGLVYMLCEIYSNHSADEILSTPKASLQKLGLDEILTAGRQNGLHSMLDRIYGFAQNIKG